MIERLRGILGITFHGVTLYCISLHCIFLLIMGFIDGYTLREVRFLLMKLDW